MSGAIKRDPGESFASFTARQRAAQAAEQASARLAAKQRRWAREGRRERRYLDVLASDFNLDPGDGIPERELA